MISHKKAQFTYTILEVLAGVALALAIIWIATNRASATFDRNEYDSNKLSVQISAVSMSHYNTETYIDLRNDPYYITFENQGVQTYDNPKIKNTPKPYVTSRHSPLHETFNNVNNKLLGLAVAQQGGITTIKPINALTPNWNKEDCSSFSNFPLGFVVLDPQHGGNDPGFSNPSSPEKTEAVLMRELANNLVAQIHTLGFTRNLESEQTLSITERQAIINRQDDSAFLSFKLGNYDSKENNLVFYVNAKGKQFEASKHFACLLLNTIIDAVQEQITGAAIVPLDPSLTSDSELFILNTDHLGVVAELGNIQHPENIFVHDSRKASSILVSTLHELQRSEITT